MAEYEAAKARGREAQRKFCIDNRQRASEMRFPDDQGLVGVALMLLVTHCASKHVKTGELLPVDWAEVGEDEEELRRVIRCDGRLVCEEDLPTRMIHVDSVRGRGNDYTEVVVTFTNITDDTTLRSVTLSCYGEDRSGRKIAHENFVLFSDALNDVPLRPGATRTGSVLLRGGAEIQRAACELKGAK